MDILYCNNISQYYCVFLIKLNNSKNQINIVGLLFTETLHEFTKYKKAV